MRTELNNKPSCDKKTQIIHADQLPLSCPTNEMSLWNAHPKVYLSVDKTGEALCPYCGTLYILQQK